MLDVSGIIAMWLAPIFIGIVFTFAIHLDKFNDRTARPIPAATTIWDAD